MSSFTQKRGLKSPHFSWFRAVKYAIDRGDFGSVAVVLKLINQNEGLSPQEIQTMTGLTSKQVSNVVSLLKKNGLVDRVKGKYYQKPEPEIEFEIELEKQAEQGENVAPKSWKIWISLKYENQTYETNQLVIFE